MIRGGGGPYTYTIPPPPPPICRELLYEMGEPQICFAQTITLLLSSTDLLSNCRMDGGGTFMFCVGKGLGVLEIFVTGGQKSVVVAGLDEKGSPPLKAQGN